jgi:predicted PurR-regulated permease PerM
MNLPNPLQSTAWSQPVRLIAWAALASAALVAIVAGLDVLMSVISAQGPLFYAIAGGWLLATLADAPIDRLVARGWPRTRAALLVWIAGAIPVIVITIELAIAFARSLGGIIAGPEPTPADVGVIVERLSALLASVGLTVDLVPIATTVILAIRDVATAVQSNIAAVAAGAIGALGPLILAIGIGIILSANPAHLDSVDRLATRGRVRRAGRSRKILETIVARFIGRHVALGFVYGVIVFVGATIAGADGLLSAVLGGIVMAIPSIGQGAAVLPPLALSILAAGPYVLPGSVVIVVGWLVCATQLAPRLMNGVLRLSGTTVFIAGSAGGLVGGVLGAIFALPVVAAVAAIRRDAPQEKRATAAKRAATRKRR